MDEDLLVGRVFSYWMVASDMNLCDCLVGLSFQIQALVSVNHVYFSFTLILLN